MPDLILNELFTGCGEGDSEQTEHAAKETLEELDKSSKTNGEIKKTWGFRRSTVAKREMPVEAAVDSPENRCPVRRSGRQSKRTDKLEEFLLTAKRASRKSAPPSVEIGEPPSQTPTDVETASEASFDGNPDTKAVEDKVESPERRTRSSARKQTQQNAQGGRQAQGGGRVTVKDEGSSENEEDSKDGASKDQLGKKKDEDSPGDLGATKTAQPELDSEKTGVVEQKIEKTGTEEETDKDTDKDDTDQTTTMLAKRGPIRTYINKKKAASKNSTPVKASANKSASPVKRETQPTTPTASIKTQTRQARDDDEDEDEDDDEDDEDDDEDDDDSSTSSSSESDNGGYDPNALYCICRQKHNKR